MNRCPILLLLVLAGALATTLLLRLIVLALHAL